MAGLLLHDGSSLDAERKENGLPPAVKSSFKKKKKGNTEIDSEVTEPTMCDEARNDWAIVSGGAALTDQVQSQVAK